MRKIQLYPETISDNVCYPTNIPDGLVLSIGLIEIILNFPILREKLKLLKLNDLEFIDEYNVYLTDFLPKDDEKQVVIVKSKNNEISTYTAMLLSEL